MFSESGDSFLEVFLCDLDFQLKPSDTQDVGRCLQFHRTSQGSSFWATVDSDASENQKSQSNQIVFLCSFILLVFLHLLSFFQFVLFFNSFKKYFL